MLLGDSSKSTSKALSHDLPRFSEEPEPEQLQKSDRLRRLERRAFGSLQRIGNEFARRAALKSDVRWHSAWLLAHRADFREIIERGRPAILRDYLSSCRAEMVPIAIWLWGRSADRFRLRGLYDYCDHPSPQVRKHVAKALRRLEAWSYLEMMATAYPDEPHIQWYAKAPTRHRSFAERLKNFKSSVDDSHAGEVATPSQMPFWAGASSWERTPPKSVAYIRRILQRIRFWVRSGVGDK